jgi:hypothetical protein
MMQLSAQRVQLVRTLLVAPEQTRSALHVRLDLLTMTPMHRHPVWHVWRASPQQRVALGRVMCAWLAATHRPVHQCVPIAPLGQLTTIPTRQQYVLSAWLDSMPKQDTQLHAMRAHQVYSVLRQEEKMHRSVNSASQGSTVPLVPQLVASARLVLQMRTLTHPLHVPSVLQESTLDVARQHATNALEVR